MKQINSKNLKKNNIYLQYVNYHYGEERDSPFKYKEVNVFKYLESTHIFYDAYEMIMHMDCRKKLDEQYIKRIVSLWNERTNPDVAEVVFLELTENDLSGFIAECV